MDNNGMRKANELFIDAMIDEPELLVIHLQDAIDSIDAELEVAKAMLRNIKAALAAPTPDNNGLDIDWDDICFRIAEKLYGHDENKWSLPYADLNVIRLVQEFIDQQLYERATNPPPPALEKGE